jgi:hypothetical protein
MNRIMALLESVLKLQIFRSVELNVQPFSQFLPLYPKAKRVT